MNYARGILIFILGIVPTIILSGLLETAEAGIMFAIVYLASIIGAKEIMTNHDK